MHKVADQVQAAVSIPLLHLADATAGAVTRAGLTTIGLLGTALTMEQDFYRDRLAGHGLTVLVPPPTDRAVVHRVIYDELCRGVIREESRQAYRNVIQRLVAAGAEGVVLGCTEIELLIGPAGSPVPTLPHHPAPRRSRHRRRPSQRRRHQRSPRADSRPRMTRAPRRAQTGGRHDPSRPPSSRSLS